MAVKETIFALSTAPGKAGIAIIRTSGPKSFSVAKSLTNQSPLVRKASLCYLTYNEVVLDQAITIFFTSGASFTGEDMVEYHVHGSRAVVASLLEVLGDGFGLTVAEPGEFTRRALENGCLDLSQVEGLSYLINSETKEQQNQSLRVFSGHLGDKIKEWRSSVLKCITLTEIMIDFSDEDVPQNTVPQINDELALLRLQLINELESYKRSQIIRDGFDVTIVGKPNVGKSSLLNYLAGSEKAIVSETAGTTRDLIELKIDLKGFAVNFFDTAGIHNSQDKIELIGMEKAVTQAKNSNMRIFLLEPGDNVNGFNIDIKEDDLIFCAKSDCQSYEPYEGISAKTGYGVSVMLSKIISKFNNLSSYSGSLLTARHKKAIRTSISFLESAQIELKREEVRVELVAEELRSLISGLDVLVGKIGVEDLLGSIFSSFCIGK